ncbi:LysE family translocator [Galactobacter caseinivorans]|uniref:Lysine transporter LysE n=1 Tax=Galactobacter caseinivorans TaxID=2676123 RepID=A0A496PIY7_9MICC|nr:LysE family transporter [Galactobacter caseinivorans]RKW70465.1 hypothetical protein DWQ67_08280 [Galactobacter caseinivorans]
MSLLPFVLTPGASFALTVNAAATGDRRAGLRVTLGTAMGLALIAAVAGLSGLGAFVASHELIRAWFQLLGGALLFGFGAVPLIKTWRARNRTEPRPSAPHPTRLMGWAFVAVVTNVKALAIYLIVVPPLLSPTAPQLGSYATVAAIHSGMVLLWLCLITALITRTPAIARNPRVTLNLQLASSAALLLLGAQSIATGFLELG